MEEQKEQRKRELKALKKELNLPHKLRMDIDEATQTIIIEDVPDARGIFHGLPQEAAFLENVCDSFVLK